MSRGLFNGSRDQKDAGRSLYASLLARAGLRSLCRMLRQDTEGGGETLGTAVLRTQGSLACVLGCSLLGVSAGARPRPAGRSFRIRSQVGP